MNSTNHHKTPELDTNDKSLEILSDLNNAPQMTRPGHPTTTSGNPVVTDGNLWSPVVTVGNQIRRVRNGKVARLPKPHRDLVNRMLFNNVPHQNIVDALRQLGITVTRRNISNWKTRGGYHEWRLAQEHALRVHLHQDNLVELLRHHGAADLPEVGLQAAATELSQFFLTPQAAHLRVSDPHEYDRRLSTLGRLALQLKALQQYRSRCSKDLGCCHDIDQLRAHAESDSERARKTFSGTASKQPKTPATPHRNHLPKL